MNTRMTPPEDDARPDEVLAASAATGNRQAFEVLYRRHAGAAWRAASAVAANPHDAADAVSDAFIRVLAALDGGRLNDGSRFRSYLLSAARNAAVDLHRRGARSRPTDLLEQLDLPTNTRTATERVDDHQDATLVAQAFRGLPERWRSVLWLTEVEGIPPREAAAVLGLTANSVSQLALRARAGLRERFVQAHLRSSIADGCKYCVEHLGAYVVGSLAPRDLAKVDQHLAGCAACRERAAEVEHLGTSLRRVVMPLPFLLGPAVVAKWQTAVLAGAGKTGAAAIAGGAASGGTAVGVTRAGALAAKAQKPLLAASTGLFALGVISASVIGQPADLLDRAASPRQPLPSTTTPRAQVVDDRIVLTTSTAAGGPSGGTGDGFGSFDRFETGAGSSVSDPAPAPVPSGSTSEAPAGNDAPPPPAPAAEAPEPLVNAAVSVEAAGQPFGISLGTGDGSCTGLEAGPVGAGCEPPPADAPLLGVEVNTDGSIAGGVLDGGTIALEL